MAGQTFPRYAAALGIAAAVAHAGDPLLDEPALGLDPQIAISYGPMSNT